MPPPLGGGVVPVTVMVNVCTALVSTPPLAVPPLSCMRTLTRACRGAPVAGEADLVPIESIAGCVQTRLLLSLLRITSNVRADSLVAPAEMFVAQSLNE